MAISPKNLYPSRVIDGDGAYPYGKALNVQNGVEGTGTPLEAEWLNDIWGSQQALLDDAGITPNGQPDSVGNSQYLDALKKIQSDKSRESIAALYKAQGYNNVFFFEDGFTYSESNDVGVYLDGTAWTYADAGALPVTIAAGTVPSDGVYSRAYSKYSLYLSLSEAEHSNLKIGEYVRLTDYAGGLYEVVGGGDAGGYYATSLDNGNKLKLYTGGAVDFSSLTAITESGSTYNLCKPHQGLRMSISGIYNQLKEKYGDLVELMDENTDWSSIDWVIGDKK